MLSRRQLVFAASAGLASVPACSFMMDADKNQCESDADCEARGFEGAVCVDNACQPSSTSARWACLGRVKWPSSSTAPPAITLMVVDVLTTKPPEGMSIRVCPKLDVNCASPMSEGFSNDAQGRVVVTVDPGFDGYLEISAPSITPALFFVVRPIWQDTVVQNVLPVVSAEGFDGIAQAIGTTLDLTNDGHTYALASDCADAPADGVRLEIDRQTPTTATYYMINNVPVATASATDASGSGGFLNLMPGFTKITGFVSVTGAQIGEASFLVRAGAVSYPRILPTP